ncbi:2-oxoadipate dioxygenase/decarboxylase HglS [Paenalcaligenes hermetiae]|uniref:2-oxoadipate dioxygenase/decarboxylase n=1 Tax=Paenalcaligenes hermetiae TaxID=1157987 RepID=A0ABP9LX77_9BURK
MSATSFVSPSQIRAQFSAAMSAMYKNEVPLYGDLMDLVAAVNQHCLEHDPALRQHLHNTHELARLDEERHGAIRVGTAQELHTIRRLFAVMGMFPVGYYDLAPAGVPVHSTAFRALHEDELKQSPFRVFTSLLRLELIDNATLRDDAAAILARRQIFTPGALALIEKHEQQGGLHAADAEQFVQEALETFRWHADATVTSTQYDALHDQHRLIADVVAFKGPHINHLTPRTLDIDAVQHQMPLRGIQPKAVIEGPPRRQHPILLRQTSFKALEEAVRFTDQHGHERGSHTARFGEIEQRGAALTTKGRELYDQLLAATRNDMGGAPTEANAQQYYATLEHHFQAFPDDLFSLFQQDLAYFHYTPTEQGLAKAGQYSTDTSIAQLVENGDVQLDPIVYEDFLPVSAAGIFQSNLGDNRTTEYKQLSNQARFERDLGCAVIDEQSMYQKTAQRSLTQCLKALGMK